MLLGMLVVLPTGNLAISDLTGTITLDLTNAVAIPEDSAWFTPGMIVLIDGVYEEEEETAGKGLSGSSGVGGTIGGRFQGFFIGQPPCEKRRVTLGVGGPDGQGISNNDEHTIGGGFGWIDFLGVGSERAVGSKMRKLEHRILTRQPATQSLFPDSPTDEAPALSTAGRNRIIMVGELNLDNPRTLQVLRKILTTYAVEPEGSTPLAFVIIGNFTSVAVMARGGPGTGSIEYKEYFDALASTLSDFPSLLTTATFVFVPGDNDGWASAFSGGAAVPLPRKSIPELFTSRIRRVFAAANAEAGLTGEGQMGGEPIFTTNPSRLTLFGPSHEIVLFRDDISSRLRRAAVRLKTSRQRQSEANRDGEEDVTMSGAVPNDDMEIDPPASSPPTPEPPTEQAVSNDILSARKLVKTLLDQGFLAPFRQAIRPIHWDLASAMHLYPLPTAAVLVDTEAPPFCVTYEGCHVMNPGSVLVPGRRGVGRWVEYTLSGTGRVRECLV
jgi:DNA polymerase epsilon subunit 2